MTWIELAPRHKQGLPIPSPVMPAAGTFGYGPEYRDLMAYKAADDADKAADNADKAADDADKAANDAHLLGAIVTNPVSSQATSRSQYPPGRSAQ